MNKGITWEHSYRLWTEYPQMDKDLLLQLQQMTEKERQESFYRELEFGTGGLRSTMGPGTNRMNIYTVAHATQGLADYLKATTLNSSCAIAYDSRSQSDLFAQVTAGVLAANNIRVFLFSELMPTPMLSFAVRHLKCDAGIVITASHNPAKYNGYKVYDAEGCQITLDIADQIHDYIKRTAYFMAPVDSQMPVQTDMITIIGQDTLDAYYQAVMAQSLRKPKTPLHVIYSPLNGAGLKPVTHVLNALGNTKVSVVPEQAQPDGGFPTCPSPNPETPEAMQLAADLLIKMKADICLATDPDCDRIGVGVPTETGVVLISGNEIGILMFDFICRQRIEQGTMPQHPVAIKTIVTTEMAVAVAKKYGVELQNVLTGFKFIGEKIALLEKRNEIERYIFGFEESYGYLSGTFVRDKDAVNASMLICEMVAYYKEQGRNLLQALQALYEEYGFYQSSLLTHTFEGALGIANMCCVLDSIRNRSLKKLAGKDVQQIIDYQNDNTGLPKSNVLVIKIENGAQIVLRPSGTEPKLKIYLSVSGETLGAAKRKLHSLENECNAFLTHYL